MKTKFLITLFSLAILTSCSYSDSKEESKPAATQREYVYLDIHNCVHADNRCLHLTGLSENKTEPKYSVKFFKVTDLYKEDIKGYCARCVSTMDYEWIQKEIDKNKIIEYNPNDDNTMPGVKQEEYDDEYWEQYRVK